MVSKVGKDSLVVTHSHLYKWQHLKNSWRSSSSSKMYAAEAFEHIQQKCIFHNSTLPLFDAGRNIKKITRRNIRVITYTK